MTTEKLIVKRDGGLYVLYHVLNEHNPRTGTLRSRLVEVVKTMNPQMMADYVAARFPGVKIQWLIKG